MLYLPGFFSMPAIDRDEARFVQASRQMLDGQSWHDFVVPMIQDRPRLQKPPLIYWIQASSAWVLSGRFLGSDDASEDAVWMYRVPSLVAAIAVCLITMRLARRMYAPPVAVMAGLLMACCPVMFWEARQGRSDMVMLAFTTASLYLLWRVLERSDVRPRTTHLLALWGAVSLGVLTKGPVPLMVVLFAVLVFSALERTSSPWRRIRPLPGFSIVFIPLAAWMYLLTNEIDLPVYLRNVWNETGGRAASAMEGHGGPAGFHLVVTYAAFFPACLMVGPAIARALRRGVNLEGKGWAIVQGLRTKHRSEAFMLSVIVPSWIVFETSSTKLPHYTLPLYPILAILSARMLFFADRAPALRKPMLAVLMRLYALFCGFFPVLALSVGGFMLYRAGERVDAVGLVGIGLIVGICIGSACFQFVRLRRFLAAQICGLISLLCAAIPLGSCAGIWPDMQLSRNVAAAIDEMDPSHTRPIAAVALHEDSLIFETRGRAERVEEHLLKAWLVKHPNAVVILDVKRATYWSRFAVFRQVNGLNYSNGKLKNLAIGEFLEPEALEERR